MEQLHVKQEEPDDCSSAHIQGFETNDQSVNGARANPPALTEPPYRIEEVYVKEEPSYCSSAYFQTFDSDNKSGARVSLIDGVLLRKTEEYDINIKGEADVSSSAQFDSEDEYGSQQRPLSIESAFLCKMEVLDICIKDGLDDSSSAQFQQFDSDDVFSTRVTAPSIEGTPICKTDNFDIDLKVEFNDCSITQFQEYSHSVSSQETAGKGLLRLLCFSRELIMDMLVVYSEAHI